MRVIFMKHTKHIKIALSGFLSCLQQLEIYYASILITNWSQVVGKELIHRCRPVSLVKSTLTIAFEDAAYIDHAKRHTDDYLSMISALLNSDAVARLKFKVGDFTNFQPLQPKNESLAKPSNRLDQALISRLKKEAQIIEYPKLRNLCVDFRLSSLINDKK